MSDFFCQIMLSCFWFSNYAQNILPWSPQSIFLQLIYCCCSSLGKAPWSDLFLVFYLLSSLKGHCGYLMMYASSQQCFLVQLMFWKFYCTSLPVYTFHNETPYVLCKIFSFIIIALADLYLGLIRNTSLMIAA